MGIGGLNDSSRNIYWHNHRVLSMVLILWVVAYLTIGVVAAALAVRLTPANFKKGLGDFSVQEPGWSMVFVIIYPVTLLIVLLCWLFYKISGLRLDE